MTLTYYKDNSELFTSCVLWWQGRDQTSLGFPILPAGVTATPAGSWTDNTTGVTRSVKNFDGSTNYISLSDNDAWAMFEGDFTITGWFRLPNRSRHYGILSQALHGGAYWCYLFNTNGNIQLTGYAVDGSGVVNFAYYCSCPTNDNTWYHIVIQRYGTLCLIYINGVSQSVATAQTWRNTSNFASPLVIGNNISYNDYLNGNIKDLMIYKGRALTQPEIKLLMNRTHPITGAGLLPGGYDYWRA